jgi:hypothetical protein
MIDPEKLKISYTGTKAPSSNSSKAPTHTPGEHFLRGPIPMNWLTAASRASRKGCGFKVSIAIWYLSGLNRQARTIKLAGSVLRDMGVKRHASYRGLAALEDAKLIEVIRHPGRSPIVTILDINGYE